MQLHIKEQVHQNGDIDQIINIGNILLEYKVTRDLLDKKILLPFIYFQLSLFILKHLSKRNKNKSFQKNKPKYIEIL